MIKFVTLDHWSAGNTTFVVVSGVVVAYFHDPGANVGVFWNVMAVAYAGEYVSVVTSGADTSWHVDGFLLEDPGVAAGELAAPEDLELPDLGEAGVRVVGPCLPSS